MSARPRSVVAIATTVALGACAGRGTVLDGDRWLAEQRPLGAGVVSPAHVVADARAVRLIADGASRTGAALRTRDLHVDGTFRALLRCAAPAGAVCAFFLYEPDAGDEADEIDVELIAGTREVWLTTWVAGVRTNHVALELPFDPARGYHAYEIDWRDGAVAFRADGRDLARFEDGVPARPMALFANAWWPTWLRASAATGALEIRSIERA